ncbi:PH domain-containing protein [Microbulbifer sp. ALW1]|uniref:PH domain-containing protein n=1 Tax=Microbulbifer sp. (strain ALW1) TaxID=1516059 RepID=UPI001358A4AF|nr:PH domain-containing protein [Microbulbifer sp. ALW1]
MPTPPKISPRIEFSAPWSRQLRWITALTSLFLVGTSVILQINTPAHAPSTYQLGIWLPLALLLLCAVFTVRGYRLQGNDLIVRRLGWSTRISLGEIESVTHEPDAMKGSIRLFGNGGYFGYIGLFRNQKLGRYRAFATSAAHSVVIRRPASTLLVTPDNPQRFVEALKPIAEHQHQ